MADRVLTAEEVAFYKAGLETGRMVGGVIGTLSSLIVCAAVPVIPWCVGTVVIAQKGWQTGSKIGMGAMAYRSAQSFEQKS
jgi:hypothetical protein